jgi:MFS family permease
VTPHARRYLDIAGPVLLAAAWAALVAWRPFAFGFYHDDWVSVALPLDRSSSLAELLARDPGRPLYLLILRGLRGALAAHAWAWQAVLAVLHLACAVAVASAANALFGRDEETRATWQWPGVIAGISWLAFPWSLGYSAWPVMLPPLVGMIMAAWSIALAARASSRRNLVLAGLLLCASWTIYEATWFFWLPPALLLVAGVDQRRRPKRLLWTFVGATAALQVAFVFLNRLLAAGSPMAKQLSGRLLSTLGTDKHLLGAQLFPQLEAVWLPLLVAIGVLLLCAAAAAVRDGEWIRLLVHVSVAVSGAAISVLLYAAAGYGIEWEGLFSRVTLAISFWLAMVVGALVHASNGAGWKALRWGGRGAGLAISAALAVSLLQQSQPWRRSWEEQQAIVAAIPDTVVKLANPKTMVLMDLPRGPAPVYNFSAFWDISGALVAKLPSAQTLPSSTHAYAAVIRPAELRTSWDGRVVRQAWCSSPDSTLWELPAERAFLWRYAEKDAVPLQAGFAIGCVQSAR